MHLGGGCFIYVFIYSFTWLVLFNLVYLGDLFIVLKLLSGSSSSSSSPNDTTIHTVTQKAQKHNVNKQRNTWGWYWYLSCLCSQRTRQNIWTLYTSHLNIQKNIYIFMCVCFMCVCFMCVCVRFSGSPGSVSVDVCLFTFVRAALTAGWAFIKEL